MSQKFDSRVWQVFWLRQRQRGKGKKKINLKYTSRGGVWAKRKKNVYYYSFGKSDLHFYNFSLCVTASFDYI